jgi:hypothetical protein
MPQVFAGQLLTAAGEHLGVWRLLAERGVVPRYAHLTLLRSALEAAVTARWLLAGGDTTARICRGMALVEQAYSEVKGMAASFDRTHPGAVSSGQVDQEMARIRSDVDCGRSRLHVPPHSSLVERYAIQATKSDWIYKVLSSSAHVNIVGTSLGDMGGSGPSNVPGAASRVIRPSVSFALTATTIVMQTVQAAVTDLERYAGHGPKATP